jgi:branched-chain amino acid transport system permease protein
VFVHRTRQGSAILALSQDREAAQYVGIPVDRVYALVMGISAALAATAGVLTAPFLTVQPGMGLMPMIKALSIVIVGGLGSVRGSIAAALLLGYAETIVAYELSTAWTELVSLVAVFMTLVLRPAGLFGIRAR